jgi:DNA-directed RNA polymerase subunit N (RpoN/RPB10)
MSTDEPFVPIRCSECGTETSVALSDLADALEKHNDGKHDGEEIAEVDPALKDRLADLVAEDLGLFEEA